MGFYINSILLVVCNNNKMEYTLQEYKRSTGKVFTTTDGHKYIKSKITGDCIYLRCGFFSWNVATFQCCYGNVFWSVGAIS